MSEEELSKMVAIRLTPSDMARLDALAARVAPIKRLQLLREAARIGLSILEQDPTKLFDAARSAPAEPKPRSSSSRKVTRSKGEGKRGSRSRRRS